MLTALLCYWLCEPQVVWDMICRIIIIGVMMFLKLIDMLYHDGCFSHI